MARAVTSKKAKWSGTGTERQVQAALKRDAVIATAARLFNERGYHSTTLDDVASELHVTKAALYYYIKDKDEILFECQRQAFEMLNAVLLDVRDRSIPVVERLDRFLVASGTMMASDYGKCLIRTGIRQLKPQSREKLMVLVRRLDTELLMLVEEGIAAGIFRKAAPILIRNFIFGAFQGVTLWFNPDGQYSIEQVIETYSRVLLDGLRVADHEKDS